MPENIVIGTILVLQEQNPPHNQVLDQRFSRNAGDSSSSFYNSVLCNPSEARPNDADMIPASVTNSDLDDSFEARKPFLNRDRGVPDNVFEAFLNGDEASDDGVFEARASKQPNGGYSCNYCSRFMKNKGDMRRHIRTHTGVKLFPCPICSKHYSHKCSLKLHMRFVHEDVDVNSSMPLGLF